MKRLISFLSILLIFSFTVHAFEGALSFSGFSGSMVPMAGKPSYMRGAFTAYDMAKQMQRIYSGSVYASYAPLTVASYHPSVSRLITRIQVFMPRIVLKTIVIRSVPTVFQRIEKLSDDSIATDLSFAKMFIGSVTLLSVDNKDYTYYFSGAKLLSYKKNNAGNENLQIITNSKTGTSILDSKNIEQGFARFSLAVKNGDVKIITKSYPMMILYSAANSVINEVGLVNDIISVKGKPIEDLETLHGIIERLWTLMEIKGPCDELRNEIQIAKAKIEDIKKRNCDEERKKLADAERRLQDAENDAQKVRDRMVNSIDGATYDQNSGYENILREKTGGYFRITGERPVYLRDNRAVTDFNEKVEQFKDELDAANKKVEQAKQELEKAKKDYEDCMKKAFGDDDSLQMADDTVEQAEQAADDCDKKQAQETTPNTPVGQPGTVVETPKENTTSGSQISLNETSAVNTTVECTPPQGQPQQGITNYTEYYKSKNSSTVSQHDGTALGNWSCGPSTGASIAKDITNSSTAPGNVSWINYFRRLMKTNNESGSSVLNMTAGIGFFIKQLNLSYNLTLTGDMTYTDGRPIINRTMNASGIAVHVNYATVNWTTINDTGFGQNQRVFVVLDWMTGGKHVIVLDDVRIRNVNNTRIFYISYMDPWTGTIGESELDEYGCFYIGNEQACITHLIGLLPKK